MAFVMSINVRAYGAPARLTPRHYEIAGSAVAPPQPQQGAAAQTLDRFTPSDRTAAANPVDSLRVAALRHDALAPGIDATDRASAERPTVARRAG